jgi:transposase
MDSMRIKAIEVSEANTSKYCRKCYQKDEQRIQGLFNCIDPNCNIKEDNAD